MDKLEGHTLAETHTFFSLCCDDARWYDIGDSSLWSRSEERCWQVYSFFRSRVNEHTDFLLDIASMLLIQGVMSAISAGMLIYAATVEMIAGDFVFGDVDGGHHHHHHEPHAHKGHAHDDDNHPVHWAEETGVQKRGRPHRNAQAAEAELQRQDLGENGVDVSLLPSSPLADDDEDDLSMSKTKQASLGKRVLAIVSLLLGVVMMIMVGIGE
jgi:zinc transporter 1/2/3